MVSPGTPFGSKKAGPEWSGFVVSGELVGARGIAPPPTTFRSRCGSPSRRSRTTGSGAHDAPARPRLRTRHRPRGRRGRGRSGRRVGEGGRPPPRPVALDREAPPGERAVQGGGGDDRAARVDPRTAAAGAGHRVVCASSGRRAQQPPARGSDLVGRAEGQLVGLGATCGGEAAIRPASSAVTTTARSSARHRRPTQLRKTT